MAFEIPYDLIKRLQTTLRKEANVSSYDPDDPSLPDLPSMEQSVSELDPSPPHLRCKQCNARLLRGLQSVACVFCGENQRQELPPDPINFKSTCGYNWFLKHLDLNATEMVDPLLSLKSVDSNRKKPAKKNKEIPLSDALDLEIKWFAASETPKTTIEASKSSLNLVGINLDNYSSDANTETPSSSNSNVTPSEGSFSFVENVQPANTPGRSIEDKSDRSFSGWQADFQPASSTPLHVETKSIDTFAGSGKDLSVNMDTAFGATKYGSEKPKDVAIPPTSNVSDFFQDDPTSSSNFISVDDGGKVESGNNSTSMSSGWTQDEKWQTSDNSDSANKTAIDDSFDVWNDFASSSAAQDPLNGYSVPAINLITPSKEKGSETDLFGSTTVSEEVDFGSFSQADFFSGPFSKQNDSTGDNNTDFEATFSDRMSESKAMDGGNAEGVVESGDVANAIKTPKVDDAEALLSQMHDLSFMLSSNLSVPPKLD